MSSTDPCVSNSLALPLFGFDRYLAAHAITFCSWLWIDDPRHRSWGTEPYVNFNTQRQRLRLPSCEGMMYVRQQPNERNWNLELTRRWNMPNCLTADVVAVSGKTELFEWVLSWCEFVFYGLSWIELVQVGFLLGGVGFQLDLVIWVWYFLFEFISVGLSWFWFGFIWFPICLQFVSVGLHLFSVSLSWFALVSSLGGGEGLVSNWFYVRLCWFSVF